MSQLPRPEVADAHPWAFPEPHEFSLGNGARVWLYDLPGQHVISAQVVLDVPVSCEPAALEGLATIAVRTSDEGSIDHPGAELAELVEGLGAIYSGAATQSSTICHLEVPSTRLSGSLGLLAEIITRPAHDPADVERQVALRLAQIEQSMARSSSVVQLAFQRAVFGPGCREGRPTAGRMATVAEIGRDDVVAFHQRWWRPDGATIILAGALPTDADRLVTDAFEGWLPSGERAFHEQPRPNPAGPQIWVVDRPGAVQADIQIGMVTPDRHDPRWAALEVAACAVGGSFASRLNAVLREELGYTYGAHAGFRPLRGASTFVVRTSCRTEVAAAATAEALRLLDVAAAPFNADEIADARTYLLGVAPLHFQTADAIADQASTLAGAGMPATWVNTHQRQVAAVSTEQVNRAFAEVVRPAQLSVVLCGDAGRLLNDLTSVGLEAEVVELEA